MELILAGQSIKIKCRLQASILMGNYEFYYAAGVLCRLAGKAPGQELLPKQLRDFLETLLDTYEPRDDQESYLLKLLKEYKVSEEYDAQMPQLLQMGLAEQDFGSQAKP